MKNIIKYICLFILTIFSFYYTDKISTIIIDQSLLMQEIKAKESLYEKESIDAEIIDNNIIPGVNGLKVNELDSYYQMKKQNKYSFSKIVYEEVIPNITIENNKDLIINRGRVQKNSVSILVYNNTDVIDYSLEKQIKITKLITFEDFNKSSFFEQINIDKDYKKLDILLSKYKLNTNICLIKYLNKNTCIKEKKYLVSETYSLNNSLNINSKLKSGDIIFISDDMSLSDYKIVLKAINYQDLTIDFLSNLISEKR